MVRWGAAKGLRFGWRYFRFILFGPISVEVVVFCG
jgi:hypothetical protein